MNKLYFYILIFKAIQATSFKTERKFNPDANDTSEGNSGNSFMKATNKKSFLDLKKHRPLPPLPINDREYKESCKIPRAMIKIPECNDECGLKVRELIKEKRNRFLFKSSSKKNTKNEHGVLIEKGHKDKQVELLKNKPNEVNYRSYENNNSTVLRCIKSKSQDFFNTQDGSIACDEDEFVYINGECKFNKPEDNFFNSPNKNTRDNHILKTVSMSNMAPYKREEFILKRSKTTNEISGVDVIYAEPYKPKSLHRDDHEANDFNSVDCNSSCDSEHQDSKGLSRMLEKMNDLTNEVSKLSYSMRVNRLEDKIENDHVKFIQETKINDERMKEVISSNKQTTEAILELVSILRNISTDLKSLMPKTKKK